MRRPARVLLPVVIGVLALPPAAGAVAAPDPCARADALLEAGYVDDAEQHYKALLGRDSCEVDGASGIARVKAARAVTPAARRAAFDGKVAKVRRLQAEGFEEEARKEAQAIVGEYSWALPADVRALTQRTPGWRQWLGRIAPEARSGVEIFAALLGLVVIVLLVPRIIGNLRARLRKSVRLKGFDGLDDKTKPAALTSALHDALAQLRDATPSERVKITSGTEGDFKALPAAVVAAVPQGALLQGLAETLDRLLPRRVRVVSGTARPVDAKRGAGLSLAIGKRDGRQNAEVTVWERDVGIEIAGEDDLPSRYERLVLPAAVWLAYQPLMTSKLLGPKQRLGTNDWRSYACFAVAERLQAERAFEAARRGYVAALDRDPGNLGALLNLGALIASDDRRDESDNERLARLDRARPLIAAVATDEALATLPIAFRARYLHALVELNRDNAAGAAVICRETDRRLHGLGDPTLDRFVTAFDWPHFVLWQSAKLVAGLPASVLEVERLRWKSGQTLYNLACFYARGRDRVPALERLRECLKRLGDGGRQADLRATARVDPAFMSLHGDPEFEDLTAAPPPPSPTAEAADLDVRFGRSRWTLGWSLVRRNGKPVAEAS